MRREWLVAWVVLVGSVSACASAPPSVPGMCRVPKGLYTLGSDEHAATDGPRRTYRLESDFYIDKYEVTNEEYLEFVTQTGHEPPPHWVNGKYPEGRGRHPVVNVTAADAEAYAAWKKKRLPTEEEWECAARGYSGYIYPWGNEYHKEYCNGADSGIGDTVPVGQYEAGRSPCGAYDMAGNVWEWTASWFDEAKTKRVIRGSSYNPFDPDPRASKRAGRDPNSRNPYTGFRCAMDAPRSGK